MRCLLLMTMLAWACLAQDWESAVRALRPADTSAQEKAVLDDVQNRAAEALAAIRHAQTGAEADRARPELRRKLRESLGYERFPWPPRLQVRHVGTLERQGYRIEKLVWQTLPGVEVPAHLYLPANVEARAPGILFYNGHWWGDSKTRPDFQIFCINMARLGFVVLTFDPFGQGERGQSSRDHRRTESLLAGVSQQGIAEYETRCALEVLLSRKEVDPERIGITGASGGGYNSWITAALDDRIKVAVPVVGTSEFLEQIEAVRPLDWYRGNEHCHFVPGLLRYANNQEFLAMAAPRPVMIIAASEDESFPAHGVREIAAYGRKLYASYGVPDRVGYFEDQTTGHGYQVKKREAAYGWFLKWLMNKGDGSPHAEPATRALPFDAPEL
ncbi:MAG: prolyl oligopeptidase family serine peptidase, partial [Bryobacterales bacterium]|nr:prolyl oligopeptidase family serine peptidase [Bryobacterales bacterium]